MASAEGEGEPCEGGGDEVGEDVLADWLAEGLDEDDALLIDHDEPVSDYVDVVAPSELNERDGADDEGDQLASNTQALPPTL